jgi:DHA2 family multidrug resistance protein
LSLALLYGALDQGQRLDWLNSATIVGLLVSGLFLFGAAILRRVVQPNPIVNLQFLNTRNIIILATSIFVFKFMHLATIVLVPGFLANIQHYRPLETGLALAWVALPMFAAVWLAATIIIYANSRLVLACGLIVCAICCLLWSHVDTSWSGNSFEIVELLLSLGLASAYIGLVGSIVLEALESGALTRAANVATFSGFMHLMRLFGGQIGVAAMTRFIAVREQFHSNVLGLYIQRGSWLTDRRVRMLAIGVLPRSPDGQEALQRAGAILGLQVRAQAYTLATLDGFVLIVWVVFVYLLIMLLLRPGKIAFNDLSKMQ